MNYLDTLQRVIVYIEEHLDGNTTVGEMAHATGYFYYHLARQFQAVLGENIGSYLKGRRPAGATKRLIYSEQQIIDITMEYGFESSEAFSHAFKAVYRMSPSMYRKSRLDLIISNKEKLGEELIRYWAANIIVHPKLVGLPDIKVAGPQGWTILRNNVIPKLWQEFAAVRNEIPRSKAGGLGLDICETRQEDNSLLTMNDDILFPEMAGIEVGSFGDLPESPMAKTLEGGRYAVFAHKGSLGSLKKTLDYIWGTRVFDTKELLDDREDFEGYDERSLGFNNPDSEMDIYIPIRQMVDR